ncbi:MAG: hypothetical protein KF723_14000 [Rhizobiaceae bacterium]|nr:hypothetical protein [Rhizobiaceae bacterium]
MTRRIAGVMAAVMAGVGCTAAADPEPIDIEVRIVDESGAPRANLPVRLVVGSEANARAPGAGATLTTDADGRIRRQLEAAVAPRKVSLDNPFVKHDSRYLAVALELDIVGRPALYWTDLDYFRSGTLGQMVAYMPGSDGVFDEMLVFHPEQHAWTFPGEPDGFRLSSIGADLKLFSMDRTEDEKGWIVRLEIEKQEFTVR